MPMNWTPEAESKLLTKIFSVCDVKVSSDQLKEIAEFMGPDCTPKAISHRLTKWRTLKEGTTSNADGGEEERAATPKAKTTKATKAGGAAKGKGKGKKGKKAAEETTPLPAEEGEGMITPPDTATKKRAGLKRKSKSPTASADDGEEENAAKKIKVGEAAEGEVEVEGEDEGISA